MESIKYKKCSACSKSLPITEFHKGKDLYGRHSYCKPCRALKFKNKVPLTQEQIDAKNLRRRMAPEDKKKARRDKDKARQRKFLNSLKEGKPCTDCGNIFHPCAMDWDHINNNKIANVSRLRSSKKRVLEEVSKCELVCANCHRIRTYKRHHGTTDYEV